MSSAISSDLATLLVCCPDRRGIVATLAQLLHQRDRVLVHGNKTVVFA